MKGWWIPAGEHAPAAILLHPLLGNRHGFSAHRTPWPAMFRIEFDLLKIALPGPKRIEWIEGPLGSLEAYRWLTDAPQALLAFAAASIQK